MTDRREDQELRDDAEEQPESGYPEGRAPTKPSAEPDQDVSRSAARTGSEAEFDSPKNPGSSSSRTV